MSFLYPENEEYQEDIEQQNNSKTAIASGELVGKKLTGDDQVSSVNAGNLLQRTRLTLSSRLPERSMDL